MSTMGNIQNLFHEINVIRVRNETINEATGGRFNMFNILGVNHYENTHSAIIAEFLNPKGSHGLREKFLTEFVNQNLPENFTFDCKSAIVQTERYLGDLGRLDLIIEQNDKKKALIIENKIYANDQSEQLKRYNEYAKTKYSKGNYIILYLTLEGIEASNNSSEDVEYLTISYSRNIINWLEECAKISLRYPLVRETINQYINHLKQLTNQDMDTKNQQEIVEIITKKEYADNVAAIYNNHNAWQKAIINNYLKPALSELASEKNLLFDDNEMDRLDAKDSGFSFYKNEWGRFRIYIVSENVGYKIFFYGISHSEGGPAKNIQRKLDCFEIEPNESWPYGYKFLEYSNWSNDTFADFAKGRSSEFVTYISRILDDLISEIEQKNIIFQDCD
jgi:hypothetical protein